jgi:hypothetical protein
VEEIIERAVERGSLGIDGVAKVTRNGEHRIRNSFKYILGGGYRLVCIFQGDHLVLLFAGSHEECHRWIENNKGLRCDLLAGQEWGTAMRTLTGDAQTPATALTESDEYEASLMSQLDDQLLRKIFCGLCGESPQAQAR